mmetsp:Transcript_20153/g.50868  ORF Transcript_20153/g.50868 Transcript_20153/m.50868 type:complete len:492 (-) Transcript_20153:1806-3281(-)
MEKMFPATRPSPHRAILAVHPTSVIADAPAFLAQSDGSLSAAPRLFCYVEWSIVSGKVTRCLPHSQRGLILQKLEPRSGCTVGASNSSARATVEAAFRQLGDAGADPDECEDYFVEMIILPEFSVVIPGLIDCHIHASQYPYYGTGLSRPLMAADGFLHKFAFPTEKAFGIKHTTAPAGSTTPAPQDVLAKRVYSRLVRRLLASGTTAAAYYATIHTGATLALARVCRDMGQRGFVGKVLLDQMSLDPDYCLGDGTEQGVEEIIGELREFIGDAVWGEGVHPVITPRFIPSCSKRLLERLGELLQEEGYKDVLVQTHVTESLDEVAFAKEVWNSQLGKGGNLGDIEKAGMRRRIPGGTLGSDPTDDVDPEAVRRHEGDPTRSTSKNAKRTRQKDQKEYDKNAFSSGNRMILMMTMMLFLGRFLNNGPREKVRKKNKNEEKNKRNERKAMPSREGFGNCEGRRDGSSEAGGSSPSQNQGDRWLGLPRPGASH